MAQGYRVTLEKDGNTLTLSPDEVSTPELPFRHSRVERWSLEVPWRDELRNYRLATVRIDYVDDTQGIDELIYYGRLDLGDAPIKQPSIRLEGRGPGYRLQDEGSLTLVFEDFTPAFEAVEQFWGETPWTATVTEPTTSIVNQDEVAQSATTTSEFETVFSEWLSDDTRPEFVSSEGLERHQTAFVFEAEAGQISGSTIVSDIDYSDGSAVQDIDTTSDMIRLTFTPNYRIPAKDWKIAIRDGFDNQSGDPNQYYVSIDGNIVNEPATGDRPTSDTLSWQSFDTGNDFDLTTEEHTLTVRLANTGDDPVIFDVISVYDSRYYHDSTQSGNNFDNTLDSDNGHLDDPRLVGVPANDSAIPQTDTAQSSFNIDSTTANTTVSGDDGNARTLQMQIEDGAWRPDDGTETNTTTATVDWDALGALGTGLQGRVDFGAYSPSGARNQTPRFGYESEVITDWELLRTTNDLSVIPAGTRYTGSYYNIAQEIHDDAAMIFVPQIDTDGSGNIVREVESFEKGDITKTADWDRTGGSRGWNTREYANVIEVYGRVPEDDPDTSQDESLNDRPKTQVRLESEITRVGQEIHADDPIVNDQLDTEAKRTSAGRNKLLSLAAADDEDATLQIVPQIIEPGYAYGVPLLGGEATLERLQFADGTGTDAPTATLSFAQPTELPDLAARKRCEAVAQASTNVTSALPPMLT